MCVINVSEGKFFIRPFSEGDEKKILPLFKEVFGQEKSYALWQWEFLENPYGTQIMLCEREDGELVAQCAGLPVPLYFQGKTYLGAQLVDCMCKKKYRAVAAKKMGLFALTVDTFRKKFTGEGKNIYVFGFPGERHFRLGQLLLRYKELSPVLEIKLEPFKKNKNIFFSFVEFQKEDIEKNALKIKELAVKDAHLLKFCVLREPKYLLWRYIGCPKKYKIFALKSLLGGIKGLCVLDVKNGEIRLIDFIGVEHLNKMIAIICKEFNLPIKMWLPKENLVKTTLNQLKPDFYKPSLPVIAVGRVFWEKLKWEWVRKHFFYTMGDCDLF